ncbi:YqgE/AlgH family protein [Loktanella fryxellensis]|nr:YqgE/AlgH family protein [Loktanella fryxellensis]
MVPLHHGTRRRIVGVMVTEIQTLRGTFLIAMPDMADPRFAGSVICLCHHDADGAMGVIVNRPRSDITFAAILDQMRIDHHREGRQVRLFGGGPVQRMRGYVLHGLDYRADATQIVTDDIGLTETRDILVALAAGGGPQDALLALGCAGWGPGQLEAELAGNDWLTAPVDAAILFAADPATIRAAALQSIGVSPSSLSLTGGRA